MQHLRLAVLQHGDVLRGHRSWQKNGPEGPPAIDLSAPGEGLGPDAIKRRQTLGRMFGVEDLAAGHVASFTQEVQALRELGARAGTGLVILAAGGRCSAHDPGARFGTIHDLAGIASAAEPVDPGTGPRPEPGTPEPSTPEAEAARRAGRRDRNDA